MPEAVFVMSARQHYPLRELAATLEYELELQGVPSSLHLGLFPDPRPDRVYILLGPREYLEMEGVAALPDDVTLKRTIFVGAEPPGSIGGDDYLELLRGAGAVFDLDVRAVLAMRRLGIPARTLRPGYSGSLDRFDPQAPRPIDVMFFGAHSRRRAECLNHAADVLSRRNCLIQISDGAPSPGDSTSFLAHGRWPLLAQTKVLINLHRGEEPYLEWRRVIDAMHAGAVVVTEHASGIAPFTAGEHLLVASAESLPFVAETLLRDEARLAHLRTQAHERLSHWVPFAMTVSVLRAAIVEVVGQSDAMSSSRTVAQRTASATAPAADSAMASMRAELDHARRDLAGVRQQLARLQKTVRSAPEGSGRIRVVVETPAWAARRTRAITVITVTRNDDRQVGETLDSLVCSRTRDFELVVVDAASTDDSAATVKAWLADHPRMPARLVLQSLDHGLGAARNVGIDFARSPTCLILDPETGVYPRCLDVLGGTLDALTEMAFVYPIQTLRAGLDGGVAPDDHLGSFLGWDPGRLRHQNFIRAPFLVRTDHLRRLGGFTTDAGLEGLEDYDLWRRVAERGWRGQLVPQLLAWRRVVPEPPLIGAPPGELAAA